MNQGGEHFNPLLTVLNLLNLGKLLQLRDHLPDPHGISILFSELDLKGGGSTVG